MKYLLGLFLFFGFIGVEAQTNAWEAKTIPSSRVETYGPVTGGFQIAYMEVMHTDIKNTRASTRRFKRKYPLMIFLHGIGERSDPDVASRGNTSFLTRLFNTNPMPYWRYTTSENYTKLYKNPGESVANERVLVWALQCWGGHSYFYPNYIKAAIQHAIAEYSDVVDFDRIYLIGLSFGGGGVQLAIQVPWIARRICAVAYNVPGYWSFPYLGPTYTFPHHQRWDVVKKNKIPIWVAHAKNDDATAGNPTNPNDPAGKAYMSDYFVRNLLIGGYDAPIQYYFFGNIATNPHRIWDYMYSFYAAQNSYTLDNGTVVRYGGTGALDYVDWLLQFDRPWRPDDPDDPTD